MSVVTNALVCVHFGNHTTFNTEADVKEYIKSREETIEYTKRRLRDLVITTDPQKMLGLEPGDDALSKVGWEFDQLWEELEVAMYELNKAQLVLHGWEKMHDSNGLAKYDEKMYMHLEDYQRIEGDFVKMSGLDNENLS